MNAIYVTPDQAGIKAAPALAKELSHPPKKGLHVRFVTRMTGELSDAISMAARREGLTAGAWTRRLLLDRIGMQSPQDARSGRPIRKPDEDLAAIAAAVRKLAVLSAALAAHDTTAAKESLQEARAILIPLAVRRPPA